MKALLAAALSVAALSPVGCVYDYASLDGRKGDAGAGQTGGSTIPIVAAGGSPAPATQTGGAPVVNDGGSGGDGGHASGGSSTGGGFGGVAGMGGTPISPRATGGAAGAGTGGATPGGTGGASTGGTGGAGGGRTVVPRTLSIDFVGGTTITVSSAGGAGGRGGAGGTTTQVIELAAMAPTEVAGVKPAAHWNSAHGTTGQLTNLAQSDGTLTAATATWSSPAGASGPGFWRNNFADAPGDTRMMNGYLDPLSPAAPATVAVGNLPADMAAAGYDVYVYCTGEVPSDTRTYRYTIGATVVTVSQTGPSPTTFTGFVLAPEGGAGNYVIFRNVTGSAFTLTATPASGSVTRAPVNGIQIVSPSGS
ncbi:MAG TPA: hypothetical protein VHO67_01510 [Polyangia bacterium]|nr:hypothetical protein [Polyangia bacterium]